MSQFGCASLILYLCFSQATVLALSGFSDFDETQTFIDDYFVQTTDSRPITTVGNVSQIIKIYAYTSNTGDNCTELIYGDISTFYESSFDVNKTTKMLIHGWKGTAFTAFETEIRRTYQVAQDVNILAVDWSEYAGELYPLARDAVTPVGKYLALLLDWLAAEAALNVTSVHILGHSLGAHVSGVVGEHLTSGTLARISGLDPAGPGFCFTPKSGRLDSSDAQFVDVIHTCGGWAGYYDPCGHVDFYPNKGTPIQPGCKFESLVCSHIRSYELFNESISSDQFLSTPCSSWKEYSKGDCVNNSTISMGEHLDKSTRGKFYLHTSNSFPYAQGNDSEIKRTRSSIENENCQEGNCLNVIVDKNAELNLQKNASSYTNIYLFTRDNIENYTKIIYGNISSINNSSFNASKVTKVVVHGWLVSAFKAFEEELRRSYLASQDVNVLAVDWSLMADGLYFRARSAVEPVGEYLALVLDWLVKEVGVSLDKVHIIGHSLGAHISGVAGESLTAGNISRITGLDPAGPGFYFTSTSGRLDSSDSQFVDVIHTCGDALGYLQPCGMADFYPNKGIPPQPGCDVPLLICSHARSHDYFNESISSEGFVSRQCDSWKHFTNSNCDNDAVTAMGEYVNTSVSGKFYLHTSTSYPYALGDQLLSVFSDEDDE